MKSRINLRIICFLSSMLIFMSLAHAQSVGLSMSFDASDLGIETTEDKNILFEIVQDIESENVNKLFSDIIKDKLFEMDALSLYGVDSPEVEAFLEALEDIHFDAHLEFTGYELIMTLQAVPSLVARDGNSTEVLAQMFTSGPAIGAMVGSFAGTILFRALCVSATKNKSKTPSKVCATLATLVGPLVGTAIAETIKNNKDSDEEPSLSVWLASVVPLLAAGAATASYEWWIKDWAEKGTLRRMFTRLAVATSESMESLAERGELYAEEMANQGVAADMVEMSGLVRDSSDRVVLDIDMAGDSLTDQIANALVGPYYPVGWLGLVARDTPGEHARALAEEVAHYWAPVHLQGKKHNSLSGANGLADYITNFSFDGDWNGRNNWENLTEYTPKAHVYYSISVTATHYYITYMYYYPRHWGDSLVDEEWENDTSGLLLVVERDAGFGHVRAAVTTYYDHFYSWVPDSSWAPHLTSWTEGEETIDGSLNFDAVDGWSPVTAADQRHHGVKAHPEIEFSNDRYIVYRLGEEAEETGDWGIWNANYTLIDIFSPGGLWDHRGDENVFVWDDPERFSGDDTEEGLDYCGRSVIQCKADYARPPWSWDDADDGSPAGEIATDPVRFVKRYFTIPGVDDESAFSTEYVHNPYQGVHDWHTDPSIGDGSGPLFTYNKLFLVQEEHLGIDDGGSRPSVPANHEDCRPDGLIGSGLAGVPYCDVYDGDGREWLGEGRSRRVIGYFSSWRTGTDGTPGYLVNNIPWSKVTHINYAFGYVDANQQLAVGAEATELTWPEIVGAEMASDLSYQGHFNLLTKYKRLHPRVKTLLSVGGWSESGGFYPMLAHADGTINQTGIDTFADSVANFLVSYNFDGIDIDFEYPSVLPDAGNPEDWEIAAPRRAIMPDAYAALMKTLRERLDELSIEQNKYFLLTSASSASGYAVRGMENQKALRYQDFTNLMTYDFHGSWNEVVGPNAPLYDDGLDPELADLYGVPEYMGIGYFNTDWALHYMLGAMQAGRVNIGVPFYTRGWQDVQGGSHGLWGASVGSDCDIGTGITRPCGGGAIGIDDIWSGGANAGFNPMWHAKNLEYNVQPIYQSLLGLTPSSDPTHTLTGSYARHWDSGTQTSWLWNDDKKVFLSTFDEESADAVVQYTIDQGAGGVMIWELAGDYQCPEEVTAQNPCGLGYTLITRMKEQLDNAPAYDNLRTIGSSVPELPQSVIEVDVELTEYPTDFNQLWPVQPTVRVSNNTGVAIGGDDDTWLEFDLPAATSALFKDVNWQTDQNGGVWSVREGDTGPNAQTGLAQRFHRLRYRFDYCQIILPGEELDIPIIYYLPVTGPTNVALGTGGAEFVLQAQHVKDGGSAVQPPAGGCDAALWDAQRIYDPETQSAEETTVEYNNQIWTAKWWTQNNIPGTGIDSDHEPWRLIGPADPESSRDAGLPECTQGEPYTIQAGDSFWQIAANELGDSNRWDEVRHLDGTLVQEGDVLISGNTICLPN